MNTDEYSTERAILDIENGGAKTSWTSQQDSQHFL